MSLEGKATSGEDLLGMSDDEILNMSGPPAAAQEEVEDKVVEDKAAEDRAAVVEETAEAENEPTAEADAGAAEVQTEEGKDKVEETVDAPAKTEEGKDGKDKAPEAGTDKAGQESKEASSSGSDKGEAAEVTAEQATAFYKQIMTPFKANGKMIQLKDPSEAIQLMQMGANYTRKLQDIQPHRKALLMLQNNGLLDEGKLSFLIDLDKKNPEAIKKLVKDAGIDPMDIDTSVEPAYSEGNHVVSDEEAGFRQALDDIVSTQSGKETVQVINTDWDQASKEALWQSPQIMSIIHEQRENGTYAQITTEMDRQVTLGKIPPNTPFLQAYKIVGDQLFPPVEAKPEAKQPVATTVAAPKPAVTNGDKASAASPTRTTTRKAEKLVNPLAMSDEEFLKLDQFNGRL